MPAHVGFAAMSAVTCVIAKTKTRSKKSSSGLTRSPNRIRGARHHGTESRRPYTVRG